MDEYELLGDVDFRTNYSEVLDNLTQLEASCRKLKKLREEVVNDVGSDEAGDTMEEDY
jgi:hypothetical protein